MQSFLILGPEEGHIKVWSSQRLIAGQLSEERLLFWATYLIEFKLTVEGTRQVRLWTCWQQGKEGNS